MRKLILSLLALGLVAGAAQAQTPGGGRGGQGGGHRGPPPGAGDSGPPDQGRARAQDRADQVQIVGVIKAIGPGPDRVTIAYDPVEALNWPAGTMPFVVARTELLKGASVGEKVSFRLDSQQISALEPYAPPKPSAEALLFGSPVRGRGDAGGPPPAPMP